MNFFFINFGEVQFVRNGNLSELVKFNVKNDIDSILTIVLFFFCIIEGILFSPS